MSPVYFLNRFGSEQVGSSPGRLKLVIFLRRASNFGSDININERNHSAGHETRRRLYCEGSPEVAELFPVAAPVKLRGFTEDAEEPGAAGESRRLRLLRTG